MEIQSTLTDAKELKKGDFIIHNDFDENINANYLGLVVGNSGYYLAVDFYKPDRLNKWENTTAFEMGNSFNQVSKQEALKFIAKQNPDGFTVNKNTLEPITEGWAVAVSETQNSFGGEGLKQVIDHAEQKSYIEAIGGWLNSKDSQYYFDAVMVVDDFELAAELGYRNKQKAVFNLSECKEYELK